VKDASNTNLRLESEIKDGCVVNVKSKTEVTETPTERALREFSREYRRVYGRTPELNEVNGYYHVFGYTDGMSIKRLREVTRQLKHRSTL
jgi:hypothetical protein